MRSGPLIGNAVAGKEWEWEYEEEEEKDGSEEDEEEAEKNCLAKSSAYAAEMAGCAGLCWSRDGNENETSRC